LALAWGLFLAAPAWPFGEFGHQLVGALAEDMLTPKARAQTHALLGPEGGPGTLAAASTWADEIRTLRPATRPWHYITFQIDDPRPDPARADTPNAVTALDRELAILSAPGADRYAREEALKWVIHLVGDLHQPLHAGERHDKGGNLVHVKVNRRTYALHAVWDYVLLERLHLPVDSAKALLEREIAADTAWIPRNAQGTPARWALETHALSPACYVLRGKAVPAGRKVQLDREYVKAATLTSLSQIKRAGARLAFVLNRALDPGSGLPALGGPAAPDSAHTGNAVPGPAAGAAPRGPPGPADWFAHADSLREDPAGQEPDAQADAPARAPGRGKMPLARYAWSANSKVYHFSECADVKRIRKKNLSTSDIPPPDKVLHAGCPLP
jgi:nuclease S1